MNDSSFIKLFPSPTEDCHVTHTVRRRRQHWSLADNWDLHSYCSACGWNQVKSFQIYDETKDVVTQDDKDRHELLHDVSVGYWLIENPLKDEDGNPLMGEEKVILRENIKGVAVLCDRFMQVFAVRETLHGQFVEVPLQEPRVF